MSVPNTRFISLQYGDSAVDIAEAEQQHGIAIFDDPDIDQSASLDDLASQIAALDLIVTISQSSAHFAGALGKPVLTMLPKIPDWRYRLTGDDTIWYPGMKLFRQTTTDIWDDVVAAVAEEVKRLVAN